MNYAPYADANSSSNGKTMGLASFVRGALSRRGLIISITIPFRWTGDNEMKLNFFTEDEVQGLDQELCAMLDLARGKAGVPFVITCGLRTPEQNAKLAESVSDSAHLTGHAVDLACADSPTRFAMLAGLLAAGFNRIGIYSKHLHVDNDVKKPANVCWYVEGT